MKKIFLCLCLMAIATSGYAKNPVVVDNLGSGDYTSVQAAIESYCVGGPNAGEATSPPFRIQIINGPYDEKLSLDQTRTTTTPKGNIAGDIVVEATDSSVVLKGRPLDTLGALKIFQDVYNVTLKNLVICISADANYPAYNQTQVVQISEKASPTATLNTVRLEDCVITESDSAGTPLVLTKAAALAAGYPTSRSTKRSVSFRMLRKNSIVNGPMNIYLDNCTFYGAAGYGSECNMNNTGEDITFNNCLTAWSGMNGHRFYTGANGKPGTITFTGTDQTAGPLNCNAIIGFGVSQPLADNYGGEGISLEIGDPGKGMVCLVEKSIIASDRSSSKSKGVQDYEGIISSVNMSSNTSLTVRDTIFSVAGYGLVIGPENAATIDRTTFLSNDNTVAAAGAIKFGANATGSLAVANCVFAGTGTAIIGTLPSGGMTANYSAFVTAGPDALAARDESQPVVYNYIQTADPLFWSKDVANELLLDVGSATYVGAGSAGSDLAGGADLLLPTPTPTATNTYTPTSTFTPSTGVGNGWKSYE